jgi:hypothetical protein
VNLGRTLERELENRDLSAIVSALAPRAFGAEPRHSKPQTRRLPGNGAGVGALFRLNLQSAYVSTWRSPNGRTAKKSKESVAWVGAADENGRRIVGASRQLPAESSQSVAGLTARLSSWLRVGACIGELVGRRSARRILIHERYSRGVMPFSCRKFRLKFEMF